MSLPQKIAQLNKLFPQFDKYILDKRLNEFQSLFFKLVAGGLAQNTNKLKTKARLLVESNSYRYELLYHMEDIWRRLDILAAEIELYGTDDYFINNYNEGHLERLFGFCLKLKQKVDLTVVLLRQLLKTDEVEAMLAKIDKAADDIEAHLRTYNSRVH